MASASMRYTAETAVAGTHGTGYDTEGGELEAALAGALVGLDATNQAAIDDALGAPFFARTHAFGQ